MDAVPFTSSTLLYTAYNNPVCSTPGQGQTPLQIAQCKNAELGRWYTENIEHAHAVPVKLADIDARIRIERVQHVVNAAEIIGVLVLLYFCRP